MTGLKTEARDYLEQAAASLLDGATVTGHNPETFGPALVTAGFAVELPAGERDALGRLRLEAGGSSEIAALLERAEVRLWEENRGSDVRFPAAVEQRVELRLDPGDLALVRLPRATAVENGAGSFSLVVTDEDGEVTLRRGLVLRKSIYTPEEWPELRALLLAEEDKSSRLLLLE